MIIEHGKSKTKYGPGVDIRLSSEDIAKAILEYVERKGVTITGPRTVLIDGKLCTNGKVYVDPLGNVETEYVILTGRGRKTDKNKLTEPCLHYTNA